MKEDAAGRIQDAVRCHQATRHAAAQRIQAAVRCHRDARNDLVDAASGAAASGGISRASTDHARVLQEESHSTAPGTGTGLAAVQDARVDLGRLCG